MNRLCMRYLRRGGKFADVWGIGEGEGNDAGGAGGEGGVQSEGCVSLDEGAECAESS